MIKIFLIFLLGVLIGMTLMSCLIIAKESDEKNEK